MERGRGTPTVIYDLRRSPCSPPSSARSAPRCSPSSTTGPRAAARASPR